VMNGGGMNNFIDTGEETAVVFDSLQCLLSDDQRAWG